MTWVRFPSPAPGHLQPCSIRLRRLARCGRAPSDHLPGCPRKSARHAFLAHDSPISGVIRERTPLRPSHTSPTNPPHRADKQAAPAAHTETARNRNSSRPGCRIRPAPPRSARTRAGNTSVTSAAGTARAADRHPRARTHPDPNSVTTSTALPISSTAVRPIYARCPVYVGPVITYSPSVIARTTPVARNGSRRTPATTRRTLAQTYPVVPFVSRYSAMPNSAYSRPLPERL